MTIRHHLSDQLLMAYSAGELPEAFGLIVATHLSMCDDCRARAASFDAVGGALVEASSAPSGPMDDMLARILSLPQTRAVPQAPRRRTALPAPLTDYVGGDLDAVRWRSVGMGVKQAILSTDKAATARLLYIPGGQSVPDHGHRGMELTLVLQGAFRDETDRFGPGDVEIASEDVEHTPVAENGEACICLAATDAPLRFRSLIPRLAQPFLRI